MVGFGQTFQPRRSSSKGGPRERMNPVSRPRGQCRHLLLAESALQPTHELWHVNRMFVQKKPSPPVRDDDNGLPMAPRANKQKQKTRLLNPATISYSFRNRSRP